MRPQVVIGSRAQRPSDLDNDLIHSATVIEPHCGSVGNADTPVPTPAYDFVSTLPYIPGDTLALSFGKTKSLDCVTLDQIRRLLDTARLPMKPVKDVVTATVERPIKRRVV